MANLIKKDVKYLNKDFGQFRENLINFSKNYFPDTYQDFNESSPGMMFIEMASYVGDVLSYYTDTSFKESLLSSADESSNILMLSQIPGISTNIAKSILNKFSFKQLVNGDFEYCDIIYIDSKRKIPKKSLVTIRDFLSSI